METRALSSDGANLHALRGLRGFKNIKYGSLISQPRKQNPRKKKYYYFLYLRYHSHAPSFYPHTSPVIKAFSSAIYMHTYVFFFFSDSNIQYLVQVLTGSKQQSTSISPSQVLCLYLGPQGHRFLLRGSFRTNTKQLVRRGKVCDWTCGYQLWLLYQHHLRCFIKIQITHPLLGF